MSRLIARIIVALFRLGEDIVVIVQVWTYVNAKFIIEIVIHDADARD